MSPKKIDKKTCINKVDYTHYMEFLSEMFKVIHRMIGYSEHPLKWNVILYREYLGSECNRFHLDCVCEKAMTLNYQAKIVALLWPKNTFNYQSSCIYLQITTYGILTHNFLIMLFVFFSWKRLLIIRQCCDYHSAMK